MSEKLNILKCENKLLKHNSFKQITEEQQYYSQINIAQNWSELQGHSTLLCRDLCSGI
jgi:hypothetical protein